MYRRIKTLILEDEDKSVFYEESSADIAVIVSSSQGDIIKIVRIK